jgi:hypothetical protein
MLLQTEIQPRKDGTVLAKACGSTYTFAADKNGDLVCDVASDAAVAALLSTDNFFPADESDSDAALALLTDSDGDKTDDGLLPVDPNAPPIESNTPTATKPAATKPAAAKPTANKK